MLEPAAATGQCVRPFERWGALSRTPLNVTPSPGTRRPRSLAHCIGVLPHQIISVQAALRKSRFTLSRSRSGLASWDDSTTVEHSVKKSSTPVRSARSMKGLYVAFFRFSRGFFDEYGSRTMARNASSDLLVHAFVRTQSSFRRAAGAASSLLAGALRFRFAGVLGGGLGLRRRRVAGVIVCLGGIGIDKGRGNESVLRVDGLVVGVRAQRPDPGPRAGDARFSRFRGFVRRGGRPEVHFPMGALEPEQRLGRELRNQLLRVDLALRPRRRRLGRVALDEALEGVDARRLAQVLEDGLEADGDVVDGVLGHGLPCSAF
mmetsp:Transcript_24822/g.64413  ORF Transcript_24822/g.64413 Transcript_24822/m.64413 type:complete len:318 (+) Transcript_24822:58-1011(+)